MAGEFHDPHVGLGRIYTRTGDAGETSLVGGQRVPKDDARIEAYGAVDELNAFVGMARAALRDADRGRRLAADLLRVQHQLFNLGSQLATAAADLSAGQPVVTAANVAWLEAGMDRCNAELAPLRSFVLPGPTSQNALLHACRTVCRRAERRTITLHRNGGCGALEVQYLNRLSDAFFVWSRWVLADGADEVLWEPNKA